ncbi:hypothetical protein JSE7799_00941 [Jannaschia seosinensis]|uniref:DUF5333 domain-containing protein n=1 Tax=Jannaschia seosinensis TaxID=313367 RepID=A0A0M7BAF2_9RHOB|nr:DUF5333 domain-containing protein [Jannaschia seosinensis]CUH32504.1 hypothetical protein JSE7799_00941 [Jannaschia seosinensis]
MSSIRLAALLSALALPAAADLAQERGITEGLINVGIAYEISEVCPDIGPRRIRGLRYLLALRGAAAEMGYSAAEIDAFIDDDAEKDRLEAIARDRLARMGAPRGDVAAHCAVGRREVAGDTQVGRLLAPR